ncbi:MAG: flavodoxin-dependent (E)-4-hydroxy-3-methylbut-2-enyl-diphosphate synthase [Firmicutes bacterium]|nr:flavodoxin-dependent (E)-4-hydroxy-3-methylbut-2-enyl-diphosphate synthase [Bacillota bacterium]
MTRQVFCGNVPIGGGAPVSIQSMTNTNTRDPKATLDQIRRLADAGCQIIRCAVPDMEAAEAMKIICKESPLPVVADIHFDYRLAIAAIKAGASKVRVNPGNIGSEDRLKAVLDEAKAAGIPIRVGVNSGSLEKELLAKYGGPTAEALAESALRTAEKVEAFGFHDLVLSLKSSDVPLNLAAHRLLSAQTDIPLHIGLTEAGPGDRGRLKSAIGIGSLLLDGIGDTMRVSLTGDPVEEVYLAKDILRALGLRKGSINLVSCPTCGRTSVDLENVAKTVQKALEPIEAQREALGLPVLTVAVMGCEVNGPGEARHADLGLACGKGKGLLFRKGESLHTVEESQMVEALLKLAEENLEMEREN